MGRTLMRKKIVSKAHLKVISHKKRSISARKRGPWL